MIDINLIEEYEEEQLLAEHRYKCQRIASFCEDFFTSDRSRFVSNDEFVNKLKTLVLGVQS
jgi:hypothetical protein